MRDLWDIFKNPNKYLKKTFSKSYSRKVSKNEEIYSRKKLLNKKE